MIVPSHDLLVGWVPLTKAAGCRCLSRSLRVPFPFGARTGGGRMGVSLFPLRRLVSGPADKMYVRPDV